MIDDFCEKIIAGFRQCYHQVLNAACFLDSLVDLLRQELRSFHAAGIGNADHRIARGQHADHIVDHRCTRIGRRVNRENNAVRSLLVQRSCHGRR